MKRFVCLFLALCSMALSSYGAVNLPMGKDEGLPGANAQQMLNAPSAIAFEENKGQVKDQNWLPRPDVLFSGNTQGMVFHVRNNGISYQFSKVVSWKKPDTLLHRESIDKLEQTPDQIQVNRIDINWIGANLQFDVIKGEPLTGYNNYYNVPEGVEPAIMVKKYESVTLKNLWPGVDLNYHARNGVLESDWVVKKASDYQQIAFEVKGADLSIEDGSLVMRTELGTLTEGALKVTQNGKQLQTKWMLKGGIVSFSVENYQPDQPMVIDPPVRVWGTYYGGTSYDRGTSLSWSTTDSTIIMAGYTMSSGLATTGAHQTIFGGNSDAILAKFTTDGQIVWSTYYGGSGYDGGENTSCSTDINGNIFLCGQTYLSTSNIATTNGHQTIVGGGYDAYIVKFNSSGIRQWGSYYGGADLEYGNFCTTDDNGNIFFGGVTSSTDNISTLGSFQSNLGGNFDGFIIKFNASGVRLWGTYFGGTDYDEIFGCCITSEQSVAITGRTNSLSGISSLSSFQPNFAGGTYDAFIGLFTSNGVRNWSSYFGGNGLDVGYSVCNDDNNQIYITGSTYSSNNIASVGAFQSQLSGNSDAFISKFNNLGQRLWSTYYGGNQGETIYGSCIASDQTIYIVGSTQSTTGITTTNGFQMTYSGGIIDGFLANFNQNGGQVYGTYCGGEATDLLYDCKSGINNNVYCIGETNSQINISTPYSFQSNFGGGDADVFLVKFQDCQSSTPATNASASPSVVTAGQVVNLSVTGGSLGTGANWYWYAGSCGQYFVGVGEVLTLPVNTTTTYYVRAEGDCDTTTCVSTTVSVVSLSITVPNGGENWAVGSSQNILWSSNGITNVKIEYSTNNGASWSTIVGSTPAGSGSYSWVVPNTPSTQCRVRVTDVANSNVTDASDNLFSIVNPATLAVVAPNGGENWQANTSHPITWTSNNIANVKIEYSTNNGAAWTVVVNSTSATTGSYNWLVPNTPSTQCKVRISDAANNNTSDISDNIFTIADPSALTLQTPNGGENWIGGSWENITWVSSGISSLIIEYTINNGVNWLTIDNSANASTGIYTWLVPESPSDVCKVRVTDANNVSITDLSDNVFTISPAPSINVITPNGGEKVTAGIVTSIEWGSASVNNVKIEYTHDGGTNWLPITSSVSASVGSYNWLVPNTPSANCKVKISDASNSSLNDLSDSFFEIEPSASAYLQLVSPSGGEGLVAGAPFTIQWNTNADGDLLLEFSGDSGGQWQTITSTVSATIGSYEWLVPDSPTQQGVIRITSLEHPTLSSQNQTLFSIILPEIQLIAPNGGESWEVGSQQAITWSALGVDFITLAYSTDNGATWSTVADHISSGASGYQWVVPNYPSNDCRVKIEASNNSTISDLSDASFQIVPPSGSLLTLTSPVGGEVWMAGSSQQITWVSNDVDQIKIEYSINLGNNWATIAPATSALSGAYEWQIPEHNASQCLVRIGDAANPGITSISPAPFSIVPAPSIAVVAPNGGENLTAGSSFAISWQSAGNEKLNMYFSEDGGSQWNLLAGNINASLGSFLWTVPETESDNCLIKLSDASNPELMDVSDQVFSVSPAILPSIKVESPNGGERYVVMGNITVDWSSTGVDNILIAFSGDNGITWQEVISSVAASVGEYSFSAPVVMSAECLIRLSSVEQPDVLDISDDAFEVNVDYPATININLNTSFGSATLTSDYRMIGLPGMSSAINAAVPVGVHNTDWTSYYDNGASENYLKQYDGSDLFRFGSGKAFWFISKNPLVITQTVSTVPLSADFTYSLPLHEGWNMITNPFEREVAWMQVKEANGLPTNAILYDYKGSWSNPSTMKLYEGYYFYNDLGTNSLKIPYWPWLNKNEFFGVAVPACRIEIRFKGTNTGVIAAFDDQAQNGFDENDYYAPPSELTPLAMSFINREHSGQRRNLWIDCRPAMDEGQAYELVLHNLSNDAQIIELTTDRIDNHQLRLLDPQTGRLYDPVIGDVPIIQSGTKSTLWLLYGTEKYISDWSQNVSLDGFEVYQNYPNPFRQTTQVGFSLPTEAVVNWTLHNVAGQVVATGSAGILPKGYHQFELDRHNLSSGLYLLEVNARNEGQVWSERLRVVVE